MTTRRGSLPEELLARLSAAAHAAASSAERANEASGESERLRRRSALLRRFVHRVLEDRERLPVRCAWCGRIDVAGEFVAPEEFLDADLPERLRQRATHGICPACHERVQRDADRARGGAEV